MLITNAMQLTDPMYIRITTADSNFKFEHLQLYFLALKFQISNLNLLTSCQLTSTMSLRSATYASSVCSSSSNTHLSGKQPYMVIQNSHSQIIDCRCHGNETMKNIFSLSLFLESFFLVFFVLDLCQFCMMSLQVISTLFKVVHRLLRALLNLIGQVSQNIAVQKVSNLLHLCVCVCTHARNAVSEEINYLAFIIKLN